MRLFGGVVAGNCRHYRRASSPPGRRGQSSTKAISQPNRKFEDAVSNRCTIRTSRGMSGLGNSNWAFITTANNSATATTTVK